MLGISFYIYTNLNVVKGFQKTSYAVLSLNMPKFMVVLLSIFNSNDN